MTKLTDLGPTIPASGEGDRLVVLTADRFISCPDCGQAVDLRDLRQVIWHQSPDHEPLALDA